MKRWPLLGAFAALLLAAGLPSIYLADHYRDLSAESEGRIDRQSRQSQLAGSVTRAADLAQAASVLLSQRGDLASGLGADLARMLPPDSGAVLEVKAADGRVLHATGAPLDAPVQALPVRGDGSPRNGAFLRDMHRTFWRYQELQ